MMSDKLDVKLNLFQIGYIAGLIMQRIDRLKQNPSEHSESELKLLDDMLVQLDEPIVIRRDSERDEE